jgi:hypothetical protein
MNYQMLGKRLQSSTCETGGPKTGRHYGGVRTMLHDHLCSKSLSVSTSTSILMSNGLDLAKASRGGEVQGEGLGGTRWVSRAIRPIGSTAAG